MGKNNCKCDNNDNERHGNYAKVDPKNPQQINGSFATNTIVCNETCADGVVRNVLEDNAEFDREVCHENQK